MNTTPDTLTAETLELPSQFSDQEKLGFAALATADKQYVLEHVELRMAVPGFDQIGIMRARLESVLRKSNSFS